MKMLLVISLILSTSSFASPLTAEDGANYCPLKHNKTECCDKHLKASPTESSELEATENCGNATSEHCCEHAKSDCCEHAKADCCEDKADAVAELGTPLTP